MLSENQVRRILGQCERVDQAYGDSVPEHLLAEYAKNQGWMQALRLVLKENTEPIRDSWFYAGSTQELIDKLDELVREGKIEMVVDDNGKLFYREKEKK
tara:strand:- start:925 stop:1221 length:297 start_codon:yes stop_codon:yes gene_type:complete